MILIEELGICTWIKKFLSNKNTESENRLFNLNSPLLSAEVVSLIVCIPPHVFFADESIFWV